MDFSGIEVFGNLVAEGLRRVIDFPKGLILQYHEAEAYIRRRVLTLTQEELQQALIAAAIAEVHRRAGKR